MHALLGSVAQRSARHSPAWAVALDSRYAMAWLLPPVEPASRQAAHDLFQPPRPPPQLNRCFALTT